MSSSSKKRKKSRRDDDEDDEGVRKKSLVDYSRVADRQESILRRPASEPVAVAAAAAEGPAPPQKMSSQMEAVVRLMTGQEERTIAQKLADSNRPTWEQYKKDNEDKLNLEGLDQKKMEEYRRELDAERDKRLARGTNHGGKKKKKKHSSSDDSSDSSDSRKRKKKHKRKKRRRKYDSDSDDSSGDRKKKRKKKGKKQKKSRRKGEDDGAESDGSHYRLSKFFTAGSDEND